MQRHPAVVMMLIAGLCGALALPGPADAGTPTLRSPASKAKIAVHDPGEAVVAFSWDDAPDVTNYRFTVATTPTLKRPVVLRMVADSSVSVRGLGQGTYYWRVETLGAGGRSVHASPVQSFAITTVAAP